MRLAMVVQCKRGSVPRPAGVLTIEGPFAADSLPVPFWLTSRTKE